MQYNQANNKFKLYHINVILSTPWLLYTSISLFSLTAIAIIERLGFNNYFILLFLYVSLILCMLYILKDIIFKGTCLLENTTVLTRSLNIGIGLFLLSETILYIYICFISLNTFLFYIGLLNLMLLVITGVSLTYNNIYYTINSSVLIKHISFILSTIFLE